VGEVALSESSFGVKVEGSMADGSAELGSTVTQCGPGESTHPDRSFTLVVTSGPDKGQRLVIDRTRLTRVLLGQSEICELRLSDREVSRRHAALEYLGPALRLTDLGSTNGTHVDRVRIVEALLSGGELVRVGTTVLRVDDGPSEEKPAATGPTGFGRIVGVSRALSNLYPLFERLAATLVPVIIEGETGTGKEALAEALHEEGPRAGGPFIIFDCTAVPQALIESELFGHERGAFTGAVSTRRGVFEQAHGGTLFIDEIGDLDLALQPKLLRAIERSEIRRVGGESWISVDVRILSATRRDLDREVEGGRFREDLFHRLAVARVELPPLSHRRGDVRLLAAHFWKQLGGESGALTESLLQKWEASAWPGNVRELRNAVARHIAIGDVRPEGHLDSGTPESTEWPAVIEEMLSSKLPFPRARDRVLEIFTEQYVSHVLRRHDGNVALAAASSGIGRRYFEKLRARKPAR
jgi:two-component system, NtrC family, response regulator HydG